MELRFIDNDLNLSIDIEDEDNRLYLKFQMSVEEYLNYIYQSWIIRIYVSVYSVKISVKVRHINLFLTRRFVEILLRRDEEKFNTVPPGEF